jgi:hypothetical protein
VFGKAELDELLSQRDKINFPLAGNHRPKRRLFEMLTTQGMQINQTVSFLSDGSDTALDLQMYLNRQAEHLFDWFQRYDEADGDGSDSQEHSRIPSNC